MKLYSIWKVPKYLPYTHEILTDEILNNAEKKLGVKLPKTYIQLLKIQNGGYINYTISNIQHSQIYGIGGHSPSILQNNWSEIKSEKILHFELNGIIPFDDDGYCFLCFDYRKNRIDPQIIYVDVDKNTVEVIAENFDAYLELLEFESYENVIENSLSIEENLEEISKILKIKFDEPDSWSHGYPIYKGQYEDDWLWISANQVQSGFVREEDSGYDNLRQQTKNLKSRFSDVSEDAIFIAVANQLILKKIYDKGIKTAPLKKIYSL